MKKNLLNPKIDTFLSKETKWRDEFKKLRMIILDCQLSEELKWGKPCYSHQEGNIVIMQGFKNYCALLFFKGVLLKDPNGILQKTGVNTRVGRQIRFTSIHEIMKMENVLKDYIRQAIEVENSGLKVDLEDEKELVFPEEFQKKMEEIPALKTAFEALTPGRQRAYNYYFTEPKQSKTRSSRVEKCMKQILKGKGLNDY